jgi:O-antigen/teichoic acid export membrane protein
VTRRPRDGSLDILANLALQKGVSTVRGLDITVVGAAVGPVGAGLYAGVQKIVMPVMILADSLRVVTMGSIARGGIVRAKKAATATIAVTIAFSAVLGVMSIWSAQLVTLVLGSEFTAAAGGFRWMLISVAPYGAAHLLITILQDKGRATWTTWNTVVIVALTLVGVLLGGHLAGATGAAAAWAATTWLWAITLYAKVQSIPA